MLHGFIRSAFAADLGLVLAKGVGAIDRSPFGGSDLAQLGLVIGAAFLIHEVIAVIVVFGKWIAKLVK